MKLCNFFVSLLIIAISFNVLAEEKQTLVIMDLNGVKIDDDTVFLLSDRLRSTITSLNVYTILSREEMNNIVKEAEFQMSDICDDTKCFVEVGSALGAQKMITGTVGKIGETYTLNLKLIDIAQAKNEYTASLDCKGNISILLKAIDEVAYNLLRKKYNKKSISLSEKSLLKIDDFESNEDKFGGLYIKSNPSGANILIDGKKIEGITPKIIDKINVGKHRIELYKGYLIGKKNINLTEDDFFTINLELKSPVSKVKILSHPLEAKIYLDGTFVGNTPMVKKDVEYGEHTVVLVHKLLAKERFKINVKGEELIEINKKLKKPGVLNIFGIAGAEVLIDDVGAGIIPIKLDDVSIGTHKIKIIKEGFTSYNSTIVIKENKPTLLELDGNMLKPIYANLSVSCVPKEAILNIDSNEVGTCPINNYKIQAGKRKLILKHHDYYTKVVEVYFKEKAIKKLKLNLKPKPAELVLKTIPIDTTLNIDLSKNTMKSNKISKKVLLEPGNHVLKMKYPNYNEKIINLTVKPNQKINLFYKLEKNKKYIEFLSKNRIKKISYWVSGISTLLTCISGTLFYLENKKFENEKNKYESSILQSERQYHYIKMKDSSNIVNIYFGGTIGMASVSLSTLLLALYEEITLHKIDTYSSQSTDNQIVKD